LLEATELLTGVVVFPLWQMFRSRL